MKGLRASVWKTRDMVVGGKNPTDISFAYIGNQIQFIDKIKYFQQRALASSLTSSEKESTYKECERYLLKDNILSIKFQMLSQTERENGY